MRYQGINNVQVLPQNVATAGFLLTWEPFDWGRRHNKVLEASKTIEQARNGIQETESQIAVEVGAKYRKWQEASLLLKASRTAHEAAVEQLRVTNNKYKQQASLLKDLLRPRPEVRKPMLSIRKRFPHIGALSLSCASRWGKSDHENKNYFRGRNGQNFRRRVRESDWSGVDIMESKLRIGLRSAKTALLFAMMAATNGCHQPAQVAAKSPTPVQLADVTLYSSSEDLRYSASVLPFAQASLSFKSAGYVTEIKQVVGADGRRRDIGPGDYVAAGLCSLRFGIRI